MRPFSNGSEFVDWQCNNCYQCRKYKENLQMSCHYETKIAEAYMGTGEITDKEAKIMGLDGDSGKCTIRIHKSVRKPRAYKGRRPVKGQLQFGGNLWK